MILYQKSLILSKIGWICYIFDQIRPILIKFDQFWLNNWHLVDLNGSFNRFYIQKDRFISIIYRKYIDFISKMRSSTWKLSLESESTLIDNQIRNQILILNSIYIKNLLKNDIFRPKMTIFDQIRPNFDINRSFLINLSTFGRFKLIF